MEKLFAFVTEFSKIQGLKLDVKMSNNDITIEYQISGIIKQKTKKYSVPNDAISALYDDMTKLCTNIMNNYKESKHFIVDREENIEKWNSMLETINNHKF